MPSNMCVMIEVSEDEITFAEGILLEEGQQFDRERRDFIKDFTTLDLHAVPGSGKTTALLAKLIILETKLPLIGGSGVLVLSHTNVAVNEIYERIGKHCPKLFRYPNFVGTIQSFVDKFLAVPFYCLSFDNKPVRIDDEIYNEHILSYRLPQGAGNWVNRKNDPNKFLRQLRFDSEANLITKIDGTKESFDLKNYDGDTYKALKNMKVRTLKKGILCFDDAYFLSSVYLNDIPEVTEKIRKRFPIVFVDEMQDMDVHQHDLLEVLFFDDNLIYQRIGDRNQAIYSGSPKLEKVWSDRENIRHISGSHRLTPKMALIVEKFALERGDEYELVGLRSGDIKPHIILYDNDNMERVIEKFAELINGFIISEKIETNEKNKFQAVGWVRQTDSPDKICISHFAPEFNPFPSKKRMDYNSLMGYLLSVDQSNNALRNIQATLIRAILKILRLESITTILGRAYTKTQLFSYLKSTSYIAYNQLRAKLFSWSIFLLESKFVLVKEEIVEYIVELLQLFDNSISGSSGFLNEEHENVEEVSSETKENTVVVDGLKINVGTVHSVKGQTTTAILYLETFFNNDGGKSYESERLADQFKLRPLRIGAGKRVKQSTKMVYVGFSRPTDLLCVAIHKDRFDAYLADIDSDVWEVVNCFEV